MRKIILLTALICSLSFNTFASSSDRAAVVEAVENFYIGDKTGSKAHRIKSMHPDGAYRYVNKKGKYVEYKFVLNEGNADTSYDHELLSIDIYDNVALAKLRLEKKKSGEPEYKIMQLHKEDGKWLITTISWGFSVIQ